VTKFLVIGLLVIGIFLMLTNKGRLPRPPSRIRDDFTLAKNKWASGTWTKMDAATFLSRLHTDAMDGAKRAKDEGRRREAKALANEILAWTSDNIR
jgi:uncharacterized protein (DUF305 family)